MEIKGTSTNISISENKPISRAFFKLIEIYNTFDIIDNNRGLNGTKVFIFPELALCGYSPEDLLFRKDSAV